MTVDYKSTVFLPKTDFPMRAGLAQKEPQILEKWKNIGLYEQLAQIRSGPYTVRFARWSPLCEWSFAHGSCAQ